MQYLINEVELQLDANGEAALRVALPETHYPGAGQALVVIERLSSQGEEQATGGAPIDTWNDGVASEDISTIPDVAVYAGAVPQEAGALHFGIRGRVGERFRVFVGWVRRRVDEALVNLPCSICRKALKAAIRAALAAMGVPTPGELLGDLAVSILEGLNLDGIAAFLRELFGDGIVDWLSQQIAGLLGLGRALDDLCRALCEVLGYC